MRRETHECSEWTPVGKWSAQTEMLNDIEMVAFLFLVVGRRSSLVLLKRRLFRAFQLKLSPCAALHASHQRETEKRRERERGRAGKIVGKTVRYHLPWR